MRKGIIEQQTGDATLEDLKAAAWDIGCTISGDEIIHHSPAQANALFTWMTEHGFGEIKEVN